MLFHFLNSSQCVACMFGHKTIYNVHSKGRCFFYLFFIPFQELQQTTRLDYKVVFVCVTSQIVNPAYINLNGWRVRRTLG